VELDKPVELDRIEKQMILLLQKNGRMPYVEMAEAIGVTEGTIRRKFNRLVSEGIIKIAVVANPHAIGFDSPAIILIKTDPHRALEVAERVSTLPGVRFVALTTGSSDLIIEGYWANNRELSQFLTVELSQVPGVREFSTSLVLKLVKQTYDWGVPGNPTGEDEDAE